MTQRKTARRARQAALLGGAALALAWTAPALAQTPAPAPAVQADGLTPGSVFMQAQEVIRDDQAKTLTARGQVEARRDGRVLRADEVVYNQDTGVGTAKGHVTLINADGTTQFADEMVLDKDMTAGFARGFSARLPDNGKLAAATATRQNEDIDQLSRAVYSPCDVCAQDPTPTWQIRAEKVTRDHKRKSVYYKNAVIEFFGVPTVYLPIFWHAEPSSGRKSGLLSPRIELDRRRGFSYEQAYLQVLSPSSEILISPQLNSDINPLLNLTYRKLFYSGYLEARAGYTYERDLDASGNPLKDANGDLLPAASRSYILAKGAFDINPLWKWGFSAERTSDDFLFDKYDIRSVYEQRGLFTTDDRRLVSQLYTTRQDQRSYLSISAASIQSTRGDNDSTFPTIAPLIEGRWEPDADILGGRLVLVGSAVSLSRDQSTTYVTQPETDSTPQISALLPSGRSSRASADATWRRDVTTSNGLRVSPFVNLRFSAYDIENAPVRREGPTADLRQDGGFSTAQFNGVVGADITMPFIKRLKSGSVILEPLAQIAISPDSDVETRLPNEDSIAFDFDETNLFAADKPPGFDLYEGGRRLNLGGRMRWLMDDGRNLTVVAGRSLRTQKDDLFPQRTGLQNKASDWVVAANGDPFKGVSLFTRARLDGHSGEVRRLEAGANVSRSFGYAYLRYLRDDLDINLGQKIEDLDLGGQVFVHKNWGVSFSGSRNLRETGWRRRDIGVIYRDECLTAELIYQRENQFVNTPLGPDIRPNDSIMVRLTLATLGATGY